jgi:N-acetylglucosamine-6-phosphate deacetylase
MSVFALANTQVLTDDGFRSNIAVLVENGHITDLVAATVVTRHTSNIRNLHGAYLLPGFIDTQVNGGGGVLFNNDTSVDALRTMMRAHRKFGTTGMLPTLISDDADVMKNAIAAVREAIAQKVPGILGIHLEGPYIAPERKGTHDASKFRVPDADEIGLAASLDNGLTLLTLAPECVPADTIRAFVNHGVMVCAGHTAANYAQTRAGIDAGIRGFTHLYNAMTPLQGREPGVVGAALEDASTWCGVIVDGVHVHPASLHMALKAKPRGKVFLVTDAMPMVGADSASFNLYGETITAVAGVVRNAAGTLAGSALDMASAVRNCVNLLGLPLHEAARMASLYPAQFLGLNDRGRIAPGCRADLVALSENGLQVMDTWIDGETEN